MHTTSSSVSVTSSVSIPTSSPVTVNVDFNRTDAIQLPVEVPPSPCAICCYVGRLAKAVHVVSMSCP
jgi:hypothetical protein